MPLPAARHIGMAIERPVADVYAFLAKPENWPPWASGLGGSFRRVGENEWRAVTPTGEATIRFSAPNAFGIVDHEVATADGATVSVPMRVVANGEGSEIVFTLFRQPGMSDQQFAADADWVARDLATLKSILEC